MRFMLSIHYLHMRFWLFQLAFHLLLYSPFPSSLLPFLNPLPSSWYAFQIWWIWYVYVLSCTVSWSSPQVFIVLFQEPANYTLICWYNRSTRWPITLIIFAFKLNVIALRINLLSSDNSLFIFLYSILNGNKALIIYRLINNIDKIPEMLNKLKPTNNSRCTISKLCI